MFSKAVMHPAIVASLSVTEEAAVYIYDVLSESVPFSLPMLQHNDFNMVPAVHEWVYTWAKSHKKNTDDSIVFLRKEIFRIQMRETAVAYAYVSLNRFDEYFACQMNFDIDNLNELGLFTTVTPDELKDMEELDLEDIGPFALA